MRFKTDENLPEEFAEVFRAAGWDALSVVEQQLGGTVDPKIARICVAERRALITLDLGFADIEPIHQANTLELSCCVRISKTSRASLPLPTAWLWRFGIIQSKMSS